MSLRARNYRLFFVGQVVSFSGTWMQNVALSFLVLHLTGSGAVLGLATATRFGPVLLFGAWGGLVADRLNKRAVLYVTQSLSAVVSLTFGVLIGVHSIAIGGVYLITTVQGFVDVFDNPARQALIPEIVSAKLLPNAVALNSVTANVARILGAAIGGGVAAVGLGVCFDLNAASFLAVVATLLAMSATDLIVPDPVGREPGQLRAGLAYVRRDPELVVPLLMVAVAGMLAWEFPVSLPLLAQTTFHGGPATYGLMTAAMGVGAVVGGLVSASRRELRRAGLAIAATGWGAAICAAGLAPSLQVAYLILPFVGYGGITFNASAKTLLQLASSPAMRGRVMSLWMLAWIGSTPIGGPLIGWIGEHEGPRWGLLAGGLPTMAVGAVAFPIMLRIDRRRRTPWGVVGPPDDGVAEPLSVPPDD